MPIHSFNKDTGKFSIQKCAIFCKFKEIGGIVRRQTVLYAAQAIPLTGHVFSVIDADLSRSRRGIAEKGYLWMETN